MDLGFVTDKQEHFALARKLGFDGVEVVASVGGFFDPVAATEKDAKAVRARLDDAGIRMLALAHYDNRLSGQCPQALEGLFNTIRLCPIVGTDLLSINAWAPPAADDDEQLAWLTGYAQKMLAVAEEAHVRIAIENCPHGQANFARSPYNWKRMFDALPSARLGLEFDPSHMIWQGIDYVSALRDFAPRVMAVHAKDAEIRHEIVRTQGTVRGEWWRFRVPGLGDADWKGITRQLVDMRFDGPLIIEHEDPVLAGPRLEQGLAFGLRFLKSMLAGGC
jgi:sugar phosphate isomerase/epimerase